MKSSDYEEFYEANPGRQPAAETAGQPASEFQRAVETRIALRVALLEDVCTMGDIDHIVHAIKSDAQIDLDRYWREFSVAYLLTNYRKSLAVLRLIPQSHGAHILDAGCGTGAASLAAMTVLAERGRSVDSLTMLDLSTNALDFASTLVSEIRNELELDCDVHYVQDDIARFRPPTPMTLIVCSHVLCEYDRRTAKELWTHLMRQLDADGIACLIERSNDLHPDSLGLKPFEERATGGLAVWSDEPLNKKRLRVWRTGWLAYRKAPPWQSNLIERYFSAWNEQSVSALELVFSDDAAYRAKPFEPEFRGLRAIEGYWRNHVLRQDRPVAEIVEVHYGLMSAYVAWRAKPNFGAAKEVRGLMALSFNAESKRIDRLNEVYRSKDV